MLLNVHDVQVARADYSAAGALSEGLASRETIRPLGAVRFAGSSLSSAAARHHRSMRFPMTASVDQATNKPAVTSPVTSVKSFIPARDRAARAAIRVPESHHQIDIPPSGRSLRDVERELLELTMHLTDFNCSAAARILLISRPTLYRKLKQYGIRRCTVDDDP